MNTLKEGMEWSLVKFSLQFDESRPYWYASASEFLEHAILMIHVFTTTNYAEDLSCSKFSPFRLSIGIHVHPKSADIDILQRSSALLRERGGGGILGNHSSAVPHIQCL